MKIIAFLGACIALGLFLNEQGVNVEGLSAMLRAFIAQFGMLIFAVSLFVFLLRLTSNRGRKNRR